MSEPAIVAEGIGKNFGDVKALCDVSFAVPHGTVLGLLGPNGAGKTTAVRVLTTLLQPDAGSATGARSRRHRRPPSGPRVDRPRRPVRRGRREPDRPREPAARGPPHPSPQGRHCAPGHRAPRPVQPQRRRRPPGRHLLRRHAAAPRPGGRAGPPTARAVPRRAHHRPRPQGPQRPVAHHRATGRGRHHAAAHHPVPGRGRPPRRPHRRHRPRHRDRRRHLGRAEGAGSARRWSSSAFVDRDERRTRRRRAGRASGTPSLDGTLLRLTVDDGARSMLAAVRLIDEAGLDPDHRGAARTHPRRRVPHPHRPSGRADRRLGLGRRRRLPPTQGAA